MRPGQRGARILLTQLVNLNHGVRCGKWTFHQRSIFLCGGYRNNHFQLLIVCITETCHTVTSCGLCGKEDSWQHSLSHCNVARCVWALHDPDLVEVLNNVREPNAKCWIFLAMDALSHDDFV